MERPGDAAARPGSSSGAAAAATGTSQAPPLTVRIVDIQHALAKPLPGLDPCFSPLTGEALELLPTIRIYGATPAGQKLCLHLHGVLPYFYIPYDQDLLLDAEGARAWLLDLARGIELAMQLGAPVNAGKRQRVFGVTLVRARPFYGFHAEDAIFVKVMMLNPRDIGRAAALLQAGGILGRRFQPYESHIPYLLQFKVEYNLYGMGFVRFRKARFRGPLPGRGRRQRAGWDAIPEVLSYEEASTGSQEAPPPVGTPVSVTAAEYTRLWTAATTPADWVWGPLPYGGRPPAKVSTCELEVDGCADDILNRGERLRVPLPDAPPELRLVESLGLMWEEERQRCGGREPPRPPPDPPRSPRPLCAAVDYVRAQFQAIADQQTAALAAKAAAAPPGSQQSVGPAGSGASASPSPARQALLAATQAANLAAHDGSELSAGSGLATSGSVGGAAVSQGIAQQQQQHRGRGDAGGAPLVDEAIVSMTQAAASRPSRRRSGVSEFLQHVAGGDAAAFDADGAIPEGDEEEEAASDADASDLEVPIGDEADGNVADAADAAASEAFPDGLLTAFADAAGPSQGSASQDRSQQDPEARRAVARAAQARRASRDCEDILAATQAEAAAPAAAEAADTAADHGAAADIEDMLGDWAAIGLDSQDWEDFPPPPAAPEIDTQTPTGGSAAAGAEQQLQHQAQPPPSQQQHRQQQLQHQPPPVSDSSGLGRIPQVDGAADSSSDEQGGNATAAANAAVSSRVWLPAPSHCRSSRGFRLLATSEQHRMLGAAAAGTHGPAEATAATGDDASAAQWQQGGCRKRTAAAAWPLGRAVIPQIDGASDHQAPQSSQGGSQQPRPGRRRRQQPTRYGVIPMASASPSASARSRGSPQPAAAGPPPQLTPQSRPPAKPPDEGLPGPWRSGSPEDVGAAMRALDFGADDAPAQQQQAQQSVVPPPQPAPLRLVLHDGGSQASGGGADSRGSGGSRGGLSVQAGTAAAARLRRPWLAPRMAAQAEPVLAGWPDSQADSQADSHGGHDTAAAHQGAANRGAGPARRKLLLGGMSAQPMQPVQMPAAAPAEVPGGGVPSKRLAMGGPLVSRGRQAAAAAAAAGFSAADPALPSEQTAQQRQQDGSASPDMQALSDDVSAAAPPEAHMDDAEGAVSEASSEPALAPQQPAETVSRSASPQPTLPPAGMDVAAVPDSQQRQPAGQPAVPDPQLQLDAGDPQEATSPLQQQPMEFGLSLQLSPTDSQQRAVPRIASAPALGMQQAAAPNWRHAKTVHPVPAAGASPAMPIEPQPTAQQHAIMAATAAAAEVEAQQTGGLTLDLYMDLSSSDSSQAGSLAAKEAAEGTGGQAASEQQAECAAPRALSLQLSDSSGEAARVAEAAQRQAAGDDSPDGDEEVAATSAAAAVAGAGMAARISEQEAPLSLKLTAEAGKPVLQRDGQRPATASQPHDSQRSAKSAAKLQQSSAEQAASSPVQSPRQFPEVNASAASDDAAAQPGEPMDVGSHSPAHEAAGLQVDAHDMDAPDDEAHSPARADTKQPPQPQITTVPLSATPQPSASAAATALAPDAAAVMIGPEVLLLTLPAAQQPLQQASAGESAGRSARDSPQGRHGGSSGRVCSGTPVLQLAQRTPRRTPQSAALHIGGGTAASAGPARSMLSSDGRASPSSSLGKPLRLSPLGSQARSSGGTQPWIDGLAAERQAGLRIYQPLQPPPKQAELAEAARSQGGLRLTQRGPFYGNPAHAPIVPVRSAGLEFRVPTSAVSELPAFSSSGPALQVPNASRSAQQPQRRWFEFAPRPPSRAATDVWLAARRAAEAPAPTLAQQTQARRSLVMDPNTGAYKPAGVPTTPGTQQDVGGSGNFRSSPGDACVTPLPASAALETVEEECDEEEDFRPPSPKYDERSFFFSAVHPWAVRTPSKTQRRRSVQPVRTPSTGLHTPGKAPQAAAPRTPQSALAAGGGGSSSTGTAAARPDSRLGTPPDKGQQGRQHDSDGVNTAAQSQPVGNPADKAVPPPGVAAPPAQQQQQPQKQQQQQQQQQQHRAPAGAGPSPLKRRRLSSQLSPLPGGSEGGGAPTPLSQAGFKRLVPGKGQCLTLLSVEIVADCRGRLLPDPRYDAVRVIALATLDDAEDVPNGDFVTRTLLQCADAGGPPSDALHGIQVDAVATEAALLDAFVDAVRALDPDILVGYDVRKGSFGYLIERAATLDINLPRALSRTPEEQGAKEGRTNEYEELHAAGIDVPGRLTLNLWRLLRSELKLGIYTQESTAAAVLQRRLPRVPPHQASLWFNAGPAGGRWRAVGDAVRRARTSLALMEQMDLVGRTGETARAFGIDFLAVLHRGSQYRVESLMARLAHSQNYLLPSPSKEQVGTQPAMEAMPLVMEPESRFYADGPVVVLDFQSLYPSQIIAYNLCFSTCMGRPSHAAAAADPDNAPRLGALSLALPDGTLAGDLAPDELIVAPNGVAFAPPSVRPGVLPRMLNEILSTRIMVKAAMKRAPMSAKVLQRVLNARQFCLKLIANVTYGYAAAGFSGRMPMAELADAIVQSGRETLENAIRMVNDKPEWAARVVYGDTDSLFVHLPGRSRAEAWRIGAEIAVEVTAANPPPVTLKLEKVYDPCTLLTKKRYAGYMYESPTQASPTWDAKGIETVRRDGCPAVVKIQERAMRTLFETRDLSAVRNYLARQWTKILAGRVSLQDFVFAKEVRLGTYINAPPAACVAARAAQEDPRAEPAFGERVPYVVVCGAPSSRLMDVVVAPRVLIEAGGRLRLNAQYYITKQINPAIARVLQLVGADVPAWFATMPRPQRRPPQKRPLPPPSRRTAGTIDRYYLSSHCAVCDALTRAEQSLCPSCLAQPQLAVGVLQSRSAGLDAAYARLVQICLHCGGNGGRPAVTGPGGIVCDSLDCSAFYERRKTAWEAATARAQLDAALAILPS